MKSFALTFTLGAASLGLAACQVNTGDNVVDNNLAAADEGGSTTVGDGLTAEGTDIASTNVFAPGARIVEEGGVTYRIDPNGSRIRLLPGDSRILIEDGVRYRVDPDGGRFRIGDDGAVISVPVNDDVAVEVNTTP